MIIRTLAGWEQGFLDGRLDMALFDRPTGLGIAEGALLIADAGNHRARRVDLEEQVVTTLLGNGLTGGAMEGEPSPMTPLNAPHCCLLSPWGEVHICETEGHRIWRLNPGGWAEVVAGNGTCGNEGDGGPARSAQLNHPMAMAFDDDGALYIADCGNKCIRVVSPDGWIHRLALALEQPLTGPSALCFAPGDALYIADAHRVLRVALADSRVETAAGSLEPGYNGDGIPASQASLSSVAGLALDQDGNLLIADRGNHRLRKVDSQGVIHTVAGNGQHGCSGDGGDPRQAELMAPFGVAADAQGRIYLSDEEAHCIRVIE